MMDELWREEEKKTLESITKLTELGKVKWECVEYNPLCFMNEDKVDETSAYLCQMFTLTAEIGGMPYELEIAEYITVPDGKGDIALTLGECGYSERDTKREAQCKCRQKADSFSLSHCPSPPAG